MDADKGTRIKLGCQTITFGPGQAQRLDETLAAVAAAGYRGVEIGFRHIRATPAEAFRDLLRKHRLALLAAHVGGDLNELQAARNERRLFHEVVEYLGMTGTKFLMYSGLQCKDTNQLDQELDLLQRCADACRQRGIALLYHNHNWEFAGGGWIIERLLGLRDSSIGLCVDVGWLAKAGQDSIAFLERCGQRVQVIHFKDFATGPSAGSAVDTVMLGEGVAPLKAVAQWLKTGGREMWVVAEQDSSDLPPEAAIAANARYLQSLFAA